MKAENRNTKRCHRCGQFISEHKEGQGILYYMNNSHHCKNPITEKDIAKALESFGKHGNGSREFVMWTTMSGAKMFDEAMKEQVKKFNN